MSEFADDLHHVVSPVAATVDRLHVKPGQSVLTGDVLVSLTVMKMSHEIRATLSGKIISVEVSEGDLIERNQVLLTMTDE